MSFSVTRGGAILAAIALVAGLAGCKQAGNSPHPPGAEATNTLFTAFVGRSPKYLDPTSSYSNDETPYTYQIYEPLYGYHYLKRPYELTPRAAFQVAEPRYLDKDGKELPADGPGDQVAETVYDVKIKPGILYAPHPAFARNDKGEFVYHKLTAEDVKDKFQISDFPLTGTRELVAADYVYAARRLATPRIKSPSFSIMAEYVIGLREYAGRIAEVDKALRANIEPYARDLPFLDFRLYDFEGVQALDDHTVRFRIKGKYPQFSYWLAMTFFAPIPWEAEAFYGQPGMAKNNLSLNYWPVGTGPYMLTEFRENRRHVLSRNPNFRKETYPCEGEPGDREAGLLDDCGKPIPFIDKAVFTIEKEAVPLQSKFLQGYYDVPQVERTDYGTDFLVAMADSPDKASLYKERGIKLPTTVEASNWYVGFNMTDPVVGHGKTPDQAERNRKLRQAISIAIDWDEYVAIFEKDQAQTAHGPIPPGLFGYREDGPAAFNPVVFERDKDGKPQRRSIEQARKLLAEAGFPDGRDAKTGKPLVLNYDTNATSTAAKSMMDWYQRQFAKLGIQLEIRATDYNRFQERIQKGSHQIFFWGWLADYPDAENFLFLLYGPNAKALTDGNGENAANYQNPEFDKLYERMKYEEDGPEKQKLIDQMIQIVQKDAPWSFGFNPKGAGTYQQWVYNGKPTAIIRNMLPYMRIDPAQRTARIAEWNEPVRWPLLVIGVLLLAALVPAWLGYRRRERENAARGLASQGAAK